MDDKTQDSEDNGDDSSTESSISELESRIESQEEEFWELIQDVRDRVIEVKREVDTKSESEHTHPEYISEEDLHTERKEIQHEMSAVQKQFAVAIDELKQVVTEIQTDTEETQKDLEEIYSKLNILGQNLLTMRETLESLDSEMDEFKQQRVELRSFLRLANEYNVSKGKCQSCHSTVLLSQLTSTKCPNCQATFVDINDRLLFTALFITEADGTGV